MLPAGSSHTFNLYFLSFFCYVFFITFLNDPWAREIQSHDEFLLLFCPCFNAVYCMLLSWIEIKRMKIMRWGNRSWLHMSSLDIEIQKRFFINSRKFSFLSSFLINFFSFYSFTVISNKRKRYQQNRNENDDNKIFVFLKRWREINMSYINIYMTSLNCTWVKRDRSVRSNQLNFVKMKRWKKGKKKTFFFLPFYNMRKMKRVLRV